MVIVFKEGPSEIAAHTYGRNLRWRKHFIQQFSHINLPLCPVDADSIAVASMRSVQVLNNEGKLLSSLLHNDCVTNIIANEKFLVVGLSNAKVHVLNNGDSYSVIRVLDVNDFLPGEKLHVHGIRALSFVKSEVLVVATYTKGIFFVSLPAMKLVGHIRNDEGGTNHLISAAILDDSRICISEGDHILYLIYQNQFGVLYKEYATKGITPLL